LVAIGNLNALEMRRWDTDRVCSEVKRLIATAAPGGGFILADNHGEIPWDVPDSAVADLADAVARYGAYPLDWIEKQ